jgi:tetratricopeptide (TPR) repeat protein
VATNSNPTKSKVLIVGWHSAGWELITPLLDRGELPNLGKLVSEGVMGTMMAIRPVMEPMVYTSLATGKYPAKHGILGTHEVFDHGRGSRPIGSHSRRAKAFWEILSQNDVPCNVVHFPTPEPAEGINGTFVSRGFFGVTRGSSWSPVHVPEDSVCPADLAPTLQEFIVSLEDLDAPTLGLFVPRISELPSRDKHLATISGILTHTLSVHAVATWLMDNSDWQVMNVNYPAIELFSREFLRYHPPRLDWVEEEPFEFFKDVVNSSVRLCDLLLGRIVQMAGDDATVILCSPRAYIPHHRLPRSAEPTGPRSEASQHRSQGIFAMRAPGIRRDELIHGVREVDLCPTVLALCGVDVPDDMDGRVLVDAFAEPLPESKTIDTWETRPPTRPDFSEDMQPAPWQELMSFTSALEDRRAIWIDVQNRLNLAETNLNLSRPDLAVPLLTRLYYTAPFWTDIAISIVEAFYRSGLTEEALVVAKDFSVVYGDSPIGRFMAGLVAQNEGREYEAMDLFEEAARNNPPVAQLHYYLGEVHQRMRRFPQALKCFERTNEIDPTFLPAYVGRIQMHRKLGDYEAGAEEALKALSVNFSSAAAHYLLGACLEDLKEPQQAKAAYANALRFNPQLQLAAKRLETLEGGAESAPIDDDEELVASELSRWNVDELRLQIAGVRQGIMAWADHFIQCFQKADQQLNAYLVENARQRQGEEAPSAELTPAPVPTLKEKDLLIRPIMPADIGQLGPMGRPIQAEHHRHDVYVLHQVGHEHLIGAMSLRGSDDKSVRSAMLLVHLVSSAALAEADLDEDTARLLLIRAGVARAAAAGAAKISYSFSPQGQEATEDALASMGFAVAKSETVFQMDMAATRDRCLRLVERFRQQRAIPDNVRVVSLQDIPMPKVEKFFSRFFADGVGSMRLALHQRLSMLILVGEEIVAGYTGWVKDDTWISPRLAVLDKYQNTWVTPMLIGEGAKAGYDSGLRIIHMYADETTFPEMIRIGRRTGGQELSRTLTMSLQLVAPWPDQRE